MSRELARDRVVKLKGLAGVSKMVKKTTAAWCSVQAQICICQKYLHNRFMWFPDSLFVDKNLISVIQGREAATRCLELLQLLPGVRGTCLLPLVER